MSHRRILKPQATVLMRRLIQLSSVLTGLLRMNLKTGGTQEYLLYFIKIYISLSEREAYTKTDVTLTS